VDQLLWKRIGDLFAAARLLSGECRIAFLKQNCGQDQDLFKRVMSLLEVDGKSDPLDSARTLSVLHVPKEAASPEPNFGFRELAVRKTHSGVLPI